jgi:hypothetical protein
VDNRAGGPKRAQVKTAAVSEKVVMDTQAEQFLHDMCPATVTTDDSDTQARRIRQWAARGVLLLTPALRWTTGRDALAYHRYLRHPEQSELLRSRRTAIEPMFDLVAHALGATGPPKQLPVQRLDNVRTCLLLAIVTVQVAMVTNSIWGLPLRNISTFASAFT